ncbi:MAG: HlyD family efflux transporter periplasmic adaptor subunit [Rhodoferax sp.]|nr:HlyD family efflux transporter periplasmic adaptor subunit [Rhodoferax sp.]
MKFYPHSRQTGTVQVRMISVLFMGFALLLVWAAWFEIDQTVRAQGQIVPSARTQIIQAADGGVLEKLTVAEGQAVVAGEVLAVLEKERANAGVDESRARVAALAAALARARAEAQSIAPVFSSESRKYPEVVAEQLALYRQKRLGLEADLATLQETLASAREEMQLNERLFASGDVSRIDLMRAKRQVVELEGKMASTRNKYLQDARQEATKIQDELSSTRFKLDERQSVLQHTELTAPMDGVVKSLKINTIGGVLRAGDELMQISPTEGDLVLELKVMPVDIGGLSVGLPASIKLDAFDYSIYGSLIGKLDYISSDTLTEQGPKGEVSVFYRARVTVSPQNNNPKLSRADLKPGMTALVDIQTGSRSVLTYLVKPITKAFQGAASER